jgi:hypothetical protein
MIVLQILKSKEMKKIAFMFVAAALFAACGEKKAPAQEAEVAEVEEMVEEPFDSATVWTLVGDTTGLDSAAIAEKYAAVLDSLKAAAAPAEEAAAEEAPAEQGE